MAGKVEERRNTLRQKLIELTETQIAEQGLQTVKARELAQAAGCSVGAIYNVFDDLQDIVIAVNGRTFKALGTHVQEALKGNEGLPAADRMIIIATGYLDFATQNPRLWRALFDLRMSAERPVPQWYWDDMDRLFAIIDTPVQEHFPDFTKKQVRLMTRTLFSSVHGIVWLGVENRVSAVPPADMRDMITVLIKSISGNRVF